MNRLLESSLGSPRGKGGVRRKTKLDGGKGNPKAIDEKKGKRKKKNYYKK